MALPGNLAPLARAIAKRLIDTLEPEDLDNLLWHARRRCAPKTKLPARAVVFMFNAAHSAFVQSLDLFPDLLASLEVGPEGVLPATTLNATDDGCSMHGETS